MDEGRTGTASCLLFHGPDYDPGDLAQALERARIEVRPIDGLLSEPDSCIDPAVVLADRTVALTSADLDRFPDHVVIVAADAGAEKAFDEAAEISLAGLRGVRPRMTALRAAFLLSTERRSCARARADLTTTRNDLHELNRIGAALMTEHDRDALVERILDQVLTLTVSDFGAIFLMKDVEGTQRLAFTRQISRSTTPADYTGMTLAVDSQSVVGHAALTGETVSIDNIHDMPPDAPYSAHVIATQQPDYWIRSMLAIPMTNPQGRIIGAVLLGNRKRDPAVRLKAEADTDRCVVSYSHHDVELAQSLVGQAAIAIENVMLLEEIENIFESFVKASVVAIDQRDPTTAGHAIRVAMLTHDLARAVDNASDGPYRNERFTHIEMRELHYAALLHDFGKIGVREAVLLKPKKLPALLCEHVEARFDLIRCSMALHTERRRIQLMRDDADTRVFADLDAQLHEELSKLDRYRATVRAANEPTVLDRDTADALMDIAALSYEGPDGTRVSCLAPHELNYLRVPCGSLDEEERLAVQMHAALTFDYLSSIPWGEGYRNIPHYAAAHHEKLNGSGYPNKLVAGDIPLQARIIAIADVFDALTASDRPYKPAVSLEHALDILRTDASAGGLDPDIVRIMIDAQAYRNVMEEDWRRY